MNIGKGEGMGKNDHFGDNPKRAGIAEKWWAPYKLKLTENYNYISKNKFLKILHHIVVIGGLPSVYFICMLRWGYGIQGKENIRLIKNTSSITVSNHVHEMDSIMLTRAFYPYSPYFISQKQNFEMFIVGFFVHILRGIPIPSGQDLKSLKKIRADINHLLKTTNHKVHIFPEASVEPFHRNLRNFKKGAFYFAVQNNVPVLPMVFVYPKPKMLTLLVGKPIYPCEIEGIGEMKDAHAIGIIANMTRNVMQQMMDDFYGGTSAENEIRSNACVQNG